MLQWMVARFRQVTEDGEFVQESFAYRPMFRPPLLPLPDEGSEVELFVPGLANPQMLAVRDESGLTIGWSCRSLRSGDVPPDSPTPVAPVAASALLGAPLVGEIAAPPPTADVIHVDFKLKRRAA